MPVIDDPAHPALADYRHLNDAAARRAVEQDAEHGIFIAEGLLVIERLVGSEHRVRSVVAIPAQADRVRPVAEALGVELLVASREALAGVAGFDVHRGLLASVQRPSGRPVEDVTDRARTCVALEGVSDNENLGAVYRTAAALGVGAVVLDERCADPLYRRSIRVSLGWSMLLPTARVATLAEWSSDASLGDRRVVALTPRPDAIPVDRAAAEGLLDGPLVMVVGAEGPGLCSATLTAADARVRIPMEQQVDSLNLATAFGVVAAFASARRGWTLS